ncbi:MAG: MoxR family ATPase [Candidatus Aureabacteria bacterium]|nr:MoxR family ATPase [Candidatus Auribacterota bacterium]
MDNNVTDMLNETIEQLQKIKEEIQKVVIGNGETIEDVIIALITGGHVLIEGVPGIAKTLLVKTLAHICQVSFKRIQFTPDLMPSDIIGTNVFNMKENTFNLEKGPVFTDFLLADEINRTPAKTQSALLEVMQEKQVTIDGISHKMSPIFSVFATQNPIEQEGTYELPEAQRDRFLMKILITYPEYEEEKIIISKTNEGRDFMDMSTSGTEKILNEEIILNIRKKLTSVTVSSELQEYIIKIVRATRESDSTILGASPRALISLLGSAKGAALFKQRTFVTPDDIKKMSYPVLRHRIILKPEAEIEGLKEDDIISSILNDIEVPR